MLNELLVTAPSLETLSELSSAASLHPPMMTSWPPRVHKLEPHLSSVSVRGSFSHSPVWTLHLRQLLRVDETYPPPQRRGPAWTWDSLSSGSEGSWHEVLLQGRNTSADCRAPPPPVMRMAFAEMEIFILYESIHIIFQNVKTWQS